MAGAIAHLSIGTSGLHSRRAAARSDDVRRGECGVAASQLMI